LAVDLEDIDSPDQLLVVAGAIDGDPAPSDFGAAAEYTQGLEIERGLGGGAADESTDVREGGCSLVRAIGCNELIDRVTSIGPVAG